MDDKSQMAGTQTTRTANASLNQSAAYLGVCEKTVLNLADRGLLKPVRIGRRRFFRWSELDRLAKHGTQ